MAFEHLSTCGTSAKWKICDSKVHISNLLCREGCETAALVVSQQERIENATVNWTQLHTRHSSAVVANAICRRSQKTHNFIMHSYGHFFPSSFSGSYCWMAFTHRENGLLYSLGWIIITISREGLLEKKNTSMEKCVCVCAVSMSSGQSECVTKSDQFKR